MNTWPYYDSRTRCLSVSLNDHSGVNCVVKIGQDQCFYCRSCGNDLLLTTQFPISTGIKIVINYMVCTSGLFWFAWLSKDKS